ncbi:MAG: hypothetical protein QOD99_1936, partial [Chthoniobacter sp.]|nr:hypothetical protein [Chthoniobacter sp.]
SDKGTAKAVVVPGFTVAGKTGTAQKLNPAGGYFSEKFVVSFVGFLPAEDPELVGLVLLDDAKRSEHENYGGTIAGPVFAKIATQAARYLNLTPEPITPPSNVIITQRGR